jgi:hypothetical protein
VLFPFAPVAVKVTMVPSVTGFPAQSWTGSVCTRMPADVRCPLMRKLQGSEATCCTARFADKSSSVAFTCTSPDALPDVVRNHATPSTVRAGRDSKVVFPALI